MPYSGSMHHRLINRRVFLLAGLCVAVLAPVAQATTLQRLTFEELTDSSDMIVTGKVTKTWTAWDASRHYIWTHYEVEVAATQKGARTTAVELSEPGGTAEGLTMAIAGASKYSVGEDVMLFLNKMPNGLIRTTGWGQGKYTIDAQGRLHADMAPRGVEYVDVKTGATGLQPLATLDGLTRQEAGLRVAARLRATQRSGKVQ